MTDNKNSKIFVSIIEDLSNIIEQLREENESVRQLELENLSLVSQVEQLKQRNYFGNLTLYFLVISASIFLALPPRI